MTETTSQTRTAERARARPLYWVVLVLALIALGLNVWRSQMAAARGSSSPHYNWLLPVALLCMSVGGLVGARRPAVQRVLVGVALVLAAAGLVYAVRG